MVAAESAPTRTTITAISTEERPEEALQNIRRLKTLDLPRRHHICLQDIHPDRLGKSFVLIYERQPEGFEELLSLGGVGPKTIRALSLISELVYGVPASFRDPVRYSFAHGGKDGHPYPVDQETYDKSIELLAQAVNRARIDNAEKREALRRLNTGFR